MYIDGQQDVAGLRAQAAVDMLASGADATYGLRVKG